MASATKTSSESAIEASVCAHCGAGLLGGGFDGERGEKFCCAGCRVVYGLLSECEGGRYYQLLKLDQGRAPRGGLPREYRKFLEDLKVPGALRLVGHWRERVHRLTLGCNDMQCAACGWLMERVLGETEGVLGYEVDFLRGEIALSYDSARTDLTAILGRIGAYGYAFKPRAAAGAMPARDRRGWMRLAVAAACFLNSMAFSAGNYFGWTQGMSGDWRRFLGVWAFASALPAVLYSAHPFYLGAWRAARSRIFTIDITVSLGIFLAFSVSLGSLFRGGSANYSDTLSGLIFFLLLGRMAVRRFEGGLSLRNRWHEDLTPAAVRVRRDGRMLFKPLEEVAEGDCLEIQAGAYLPVDGWAQSEGGQADTAFLTGEDGPRAFRAGDFLFAGTRVLGKDLRLLAAAARRESKVQGWLRALDSLKERKRGRSRKRDRVALIFTLAVIASALAAFFLHRSEGWIRALEISASVFIVSCSCSLALAVPLSRGVGLLRAHRLGFQFRDPEVLERLASMRAVIFDKTGTLTFTERRVTRWDWSPAFGDRKLRSAILAGAKGLTERSLHPVSSAIHASLPEGGVSISGFAEAPHFGISGNMPGLPAFRLCLCRFGAWEDKCGPFRDLNLEPPASEEVLAEPPPQACLFVNGRFAAGIHLSENVKPGVPDLLDGLEARGLRVLLLSGDQPERVKIFARQCGFASFRGGLSPEEKQIEARKFQESTGPALAVGDGFNDSLLFGEAESSLAVQGAAGAMAEEADAFTTNRNPGALLSLLGISDGVRRSLRNCYVVSAVYNVAAISLAVAGRVSPLFAAVLMPVAGLSLCATAWISVPRR